MNRERRTGKPAIPKNVRGLLTIPQKRTLKELETFGWVIDFVRHPLFQDPKIVVRDPKTAKQAIILEDGSVDHNPTDLIRK